MSHAKDDDQVGVDRQERIAREVAGRLGLVVQSRHVFVDNNRSAWRRNRKRKGWDELLAAVQAGQVRHVIAYHPDRLMRQPRDLEELLAVAEEKSVTLHGEANNRDLANPDDVFILRIEVAHACRSSDDTSRRLKSAMVDRAGDGLPHPGQRRYGYTPDGMTVIAAEAEVVKEIFAGYLDGADAAAIARRLNARGVATTQGKVWQADSVLAVLDSRHVAGIQVFRGQEVGAGSWPAIIDAGTWVEVRDRRAVRAAVWATGRQPAFYLLRGLVTCKRCGVRMAGSATGGSPSYVCSRRRRQDEARCVRRVTARYVDGFVSDAAVALLTDLQPVASAEAAGGLSEADQAAVAADEAELVELKEMWQARELSTREYRQMRRVVEERVKKLQRKTVVRPAAEVLDGMVGPGARAAWDRLQAAGDYPRMNAVLRFLFAAVLVDESHARTGEFDYSRIEIEPNPL
jgi:site-specific DNA recombinase